MSLDDKKVVEGLRDKIPFSPIDDRILVKPLKAVKIKKKFPEYPEEPGEDATAEEKLEFSNKKVKWKTKTVESNMTKGVVLKIGKTGSLTNIPIGKTGSLTNIPIGKTGSLTNIPFEEGDTVVFPTTAGQNFELFKDTKLLKRYEIMGLWIEEKE